MSGRLVMVYMIINEVLFIDFAHNFSNTMHFLHDAAKLTLLERRKVQY